MSNWSAYEEIIDFAIENEEEAYNFYKELASKMEKPAMKDVFNGFAQEEKGHKQRLLDVKAGKQGLSVPKKTPDLKMSDYLVDVAPRSDMSYQDALILAMKKEKAAYRLYTDIAANAEDAKIRQLFMQLAEEEAKHKLRFEIEYDDMMQEN